MDKLNYKLVASDSELEGAFEVRRRVFVERYAVRLGEIDIKHSFTGWIDTLVRLLPARRTTCRGLVARCNHQSPPESGVLVHIR